MTIDERVDSLIRALAHLRGKSGSAYQHELETYQKNLRFTLLEVARDQRHACAEAVLAVDRNAWSMDAAHNAAMNAKIG